MSFLNGESAPRRNGWLPVSGWPLPVVILSLACFVSPLHALTPPILKIADNAGNSVTIDSTGVPSGVGSFSTASVHTAAGFISFSGTVGNFLLANINLESKPLLAPPALDAEIGFVIDNGSSAGTITISITDTGFSATGPETITVLGGSGGTFSAYFDTGNVPFGMNTPVATVASPSAPTTTLMFDVIPGKTSPVSMTEVVTIPLAPGGKFNDDFGFLATTAPPPPALQLSCPSTITAQAGVPYSSSLTATNGVPPYTFSILSGSLPPGLNLNSSTGAIMGTPTVSGSFPFVAQVTDSEIPPATATSGSCGISVGSVGMCVERYFSNLPAGESYVDITNNGANGAPPLGPGFGAAAGNICVNVYTLDTDEELVSCCSCLVTPDQTLSLGVKQDLISSTLTSSKPSSVTVKLCATLAGPNGQNTSCSGSATNLSSLVDGLNAWGTTLHAAPSGGYAGTETPFSQVTNNTAELSSISGRCASILGNGSGSGICAACRVGTLGAAGLSY